MIRLRSIGIVRNPVNSPYGYNLTFVCFPPRMDGLGIVLKSLGPYREAQGFTEASIATGEVRFRE